MEMVFLHQPAHRWLHLRRHTLISPPRISTAREAHRPGPAQASRPPWTFIPRSIHGVPHLGSPVGRNHLSLVGTPNHRPSRHLCRLALRFPGRRGPNARDRHGSDPSRPEPFRRWQYAFHVPPLWWNDGCRLLPNHLVPGGSRPVGHGSRYPHHPSGLGPGRHGHRGRHLHRKHRILRSRHAAFSLSLRRRRRYAFNLYTERSQQPLDWLPSHLRHRHRLRLPDLQPGASKRPASCRRPSRHGPNVLYAAARRLRLPRRRSKHLLPPAR